jgi:uncharacterized protein (DUF1800 family)
VTLTNLIAANRFGLGARPDELASIGTDPRGWLAAQIQGTRSHPDAIRSLPTSAQVFAAYTQGQEAKRDLRKESGKQAERVQKLIANIRQKVVPIYLDQVAARYRIAATTTEPFRERLVHFWSNHFAVSADKAAVIGLAGTLENEAIRPNLQARFIDLLYAVESHPAMILYLDNQASIGPDSKLATRAARRLQSSGRKVGINENLAREILELHTLGVGSGYSQTDVSAFAEALTGWSVGGGGRGMLAEGEPGKYVFRENFHQPGAKTILGKRYGADGPGQARAVLRDVASHPATATHIATKLVRHFIADDPPSAAVEHVAKVFRDSDGNLPAVHAALIDLPQVATQPPPKFKTPHEFVISALRMLDFVPDKPQQVLAPFQLLGQRPWSPGSPAGWPDTADQWDGPDALLRRIEWATQVADRIGSKSRPLQVGMQSLGTALTQRTSTAISRAESGAQGLTLLLVSPEFQRR